MSTVKYPDIFDELKAEVRAAGLLERVPVRGSIEMIATAISMILVYTIVVNWNMFLGVWWATFALALFMTVIFTRAVFISHDILHTQYFATSILRDDIVSVPAFQIDSKVVCGSGDAWNAGLIYGLLFDLNQIDQLVLANTVAALYISSHDSSPPSRNDVIHCLISKPILSSIGKNLLMESFQSIKGNCFARLRERS